MENDLDLKLWICHSIVKYLISLDYSYPCCTMEIFHAVYIYIYIYKPREIISEKIIYEMSSALLNFFFPISNLPSFLITFHTPTFAIPLNSTLNCSCLKNQTIENQNQEINKRFKDIYLEIKSK
jgi:hypothetical protein